MYVCVLYAGKVADWLADWEQWLNYFDKHSAALPLFLERKLFNKRFETFVFVFVAARKIKTYRCFPHFIWTGFSLFIYTESHGKFTECCISSFWNCYFCVYFRKVGFLCAACKECKTWKCFLFVIYNRNEMNPNRKKTNKQRQHCQIATVF